MSKANVGHPIFRREITEVRTTSYPAGEAQIPKLDKRPPGPWRRRGRNSSHNPFAVTGLVVLLIFILAAIFAQWIAPYDPPALI